MALVDVSEIKSDDSYASLGLKSYTSDVLDDAGNPTNKKTTTYFDADFNVIGTLTVDSVTGEESFNIKYSDGSGGFIEKGSYLEQTGAVETSWNYTYTSGNVFDGGTETFGSTVTTVDKNWNVTSEKATLGSLSGKERTDFTGVNAQVYDDTGTVYSAKDGTTVTYYDATGAITGYEYQTATGSSFFTADDVWVGSSYDDGTITETINITYVGNEGAYKETGTYDDGVAARTFEFNFDKDGNLTSGTETVGSLTTNYGANWKVDSQKFTVDTSKAEAAPDDIPSGFSYTDSVKGSVVLTTEEDLSDTDKEVTYYDASGNVLGHAITFPNGKTFFDDEWNWVGEVFSDGTRSVEIFMEDLGNGTSKEVGKETEGNTWAREWTFIFDNTTEPQTFLSGTEKLNGVITTFGENWSIEGQAADTTSLGKITRQSDLDDLPDAFVSNQTDANGVTSEIAYYKITQDEDWGTETKYFDADGNPLGDSFAWSDGAFSGTSFHDANGMFIGDIFIEPVSEPGAAIEVLRTVTRFETQNSDGTITEKGSEYENTTLIRSWEFIFDSGYRLKEGSETIDGVTTTFGANWEIKGEKADTTSLQEVDLDTPLLDTTKLGDLFNFTVTVDGVEVTKGFIKTKVMDWGDVETTYVNAAGEVVGRKNAYEFTFTDFEGKEIKQTGASYFDADDKWIGDTFADDFMTGGRFEFQVDGGRREIGSETAADGSFSRSFDFIFKGGKLDSGTEINNGVTIEYGPDWQILSQKMDTGGLPTVSSEELAYLPASFTVGGAPIYSETTLPWGDVETTYFDQSGNVLGYSNSWTDPMGGSGTSFNGPDWQYLGDVFEMKEGEDTYTYVRFETETDGVRTETGSEYKNGVLERSWEFNFDGFEMVGGTETRADGVIVEFDPGWAIKSEKADPTKLGEPIDLKAELGNGATLEAIFDFKVAGVDAPSGYASVNGTAAEGFIETVYYNQEGKIVGRSEQNVFTPDESDYTPPLVFFRADTGEGSWIDFMGIGVDGLVDGYDGQGVLIALDWSDEQITDTTTTAELLAQFVSPDTDQEIPSDRPYGPGTQGWFQAFAQQSDSGLSFDATSGVASGTLKGYVISDVNSDSPKPVKEVAVSVSTSDTLEYQYFWNGESSGQYFVDGLINSTFELDGVEVIDAARKKAEDNPPTQTNYFDAEWEFVGETSTGSQGDARSVFRVETAEGYTEIGSESDPYWSREWEFNFKKVGQDYVFDGGEETENGVTREINALGETTKEKIDPTKLLEATSDQLVSILDVFKTTVDGSETAFYFVQKHPGGVETFYFDGTGAALGRANAWSDDNHGGAQGVDYFDASGKFFGNTYKDDYMEFSRIETPATFDGQNAIKETGSEKFDGQEPRTWEYFFSADGNYEFLGGTEIFGSSTITFGKHWVIEDEKFDIDPAKDTSFVALEASELTDPLLKIGDATEVAGGLVTFVDLYQDYAGAAADKIGFKQVNGNETVYFSGSGEIIGRKYEDSWTFEGQTETRTEYLDANWNFLGEVFDGQFFDRSFFIVKTADGYTEVMSENESAPAAGGGFETVFSRDAVFNFKDSTDPGGFPEFAGGFEIENGKTFQLDANWNRAAEKLGAEFLNKHVVNSTNADATLFVDFQDALSILGNLATPIDPSGDPADPTNYQFYGEVVRQDDTRGEQQIDIYNGEGVLIGEIFTFTDWSGETVADFHAISPTEFKFLGQIRLSSDFKQITTEGVDDVDPSIEVRTTTRYSYDNTNKIWVEEEQIVDRFDDTGAYIGGSETFNGVTTIFNDDGSTETRGDTSKLSALGSAGMEALDTVVVTFPTDPVREVTIKELYYSSDDTTGFVSIENFGQTQKTTYYDASGDTVGYKYVDTFGSGVDVETFAYYENAYGHFIGNTYENSSFRKANFELGNGQGAKTYYFFEEDTGHSFYSQETYNQEGKAVTGFEIMNGVTTVLEPSEDGNYFERGEATVDLGTIAGIETITDTNALLDIPAEFIFDDGGRKAVRLEVFKEDLGDVIWQDYAYYNNAGVELGMAYVDSYDYDDDDVADYIEIRFEGQNGYQLGRIEENVGTSKFVRFESRELSDGITKRIEEEYNYDGSGNETSYRKSVYNDATGQFLEGLERIGATTVNYGVDRTVEGETFSGTTSAITISELSSALPELWTNEGAVTQAVVKTRDGADVDLTVDLFQAGKKVGDADIQITYFVPGNSASGVKFADVTVYDNMSYDGPVGKTTVFTTADNVTTTLTSTTSKYPGVGKEINSSWIETNATGVVLYERIEYEQFDLINGMDVYNNGWVKENGVTTFFAGAERLPQGSNQAATMDGAVPGQVFEVAGPVSAKEGAETVKSGKFTFSDPDGDTVVVDVSNTNHAPAVQTKEGLYGTFTFDTTPGSNYGNYTYTLDVAKAANLPNGAVVYEEFALRLQDFGAGQNPASDAPNQEAYQRIAFEVQGAGTGGASGSLVTSYDAGTHGAVDLREYSFTGYSFTIEKIPGIPATEVPVGTPIASAATMKIIGSADLEIDQTILKVGLDDVPQMNVTKGQIFDIQIDGVSVVDKLDYAQIGLTRYEGEYLPDGKTDPADSVSYSTLVNEIYLQYMEGGKQLVDGFVFYVDGDTIAGGVPSDSEIMQIMSDAESGEYLNGPLLPFAYYPLVQDDPFTGSLVVDTAFSLDIPGPTDTHAAVEFDFAGQTVPADLMPMEEGGQWSLNIGAPIEISGAKIDAAINANELGISLKLDQLAKFASSKSATITVTVRDVMANIPGDATEPEMQALMHASVGTRGNDEREISMRFDVVADGTGTTASIKAISQFVEVEYRGVGDASPTTTDFENSTADLFQIVGDTSLDIALGSLIGKMKEFVGKEVLSKKGLYEFEISGLGELLEEDGNVISKINGLIDVTSDGGTVTPPVTPQEKFSLDHDSDPVTFAFASGNESVNLSHVGDTLSATNTLGVKSSDIDTAIKGGALDVTLKLDNVAKVAGKIEKNVTVTFRDVKADFFSAVTELQKQALMDATVGTRDNDEREISLKFKVEVSGNGTDVQVKSPSGETIDVEYYGVGDASPSTTSFENEIEDLVALHGTTYFSIKLSALLDKLSGYVDQSMLMDAGLYEYEISGLADILEEGGAGINKITGLIDVTDDIGGYPVGQNPFSIDIAAEAKNEVSIDGKKIDVDVAYEDEGYRVADIDVDLPTIERALDGGNFSVSFDIDKIAKLDTEQTQQVHVRLRDVNKDVLTWDDGERQLDIYFDVKFSGNGTNASVQSVTDSPIKIFYTNASKHVADLSQTNLDVDLVSFNAGTTSMSFNLGSILNRVEGVFGEGALSQTGSYQYKIFLKDPYLLDETNGGGTTGPVKSIDGVINVSAPSPVLDGSTLSYDPDGKSSTMNREQIDLFDLISSGKALTLSTQTVNEFGNPSFKIAPELSLKVADELFIGPEGAQNWSQTFRVEVIEDIGADAKKREANEMSATIEFDLNFAKSGDELVITAPQNGEIDVDIVTSSNTTVDFKLVNGDSDQFVIAKNAVSDAPASLNIKLDSILEKAGIQLEAKHLDVPTVLDGDKFYLDVVNVNPGTPETIEPLFDLSIIIEDPLAILPG